MVLVKKAMGSEEINPTSTQAGSGCLCRPEARAQDPLDLQAVRLEICLQQLFKVRKATVGPLLVVLSWWPLCVMECAG